MQLVIAVGMRVTSSVVGSVYWCLLMRGYESEHARERERERWVGGRE